MQHLSSVLDVGDNYDALILDLWGVIHDGQSLYPGVREVLTTLREQKKQIIFLSNAPRRAYKAEQVLQNLGIGHELYDHVITSGEAVYGHLSENKKTGKNYYFIGPDKDLDLLSGLSYSRTELEQSDFILNAGFFDDFQPIEALEDTLKTGVALKKKMICANPDKIVVRRNGEKLGCAGLIAEEYEKRGGIVQYFGKPYPEVYKLCLARFDNVKKNRILAVGDSLETDIKGAAQMGMDTALVTGGILKEALHFAGDAPDAETLRRLCLEAQCMPTYILPSLGMGS